MNLIKKGKELLEKELCDHCLGRQFAQLGHGLSNDERGKALRVFIAMHESNDEKVQVKREPDTCEICGDLFEEVDKFASLVSDEFQRYEFDTFLIGSRIDPEIEEMEERLWTELNIETSSPIKTEINREVGKRVDGMIAAEVDLEAPDIKGIIDTRFDYVEIELSPLFIYGRYRKLERGIPQTSWYCNRCRGEGCERCGWTGKMYETSVEEIIGEPLLELTEGDEFTLHGMGREDIDARMLGSGRPFVIEVKNPVKRRIDLEGFAGSVEKDGRVEIDELTFCDRRKVQEIKGTPVDKSYRVEIKFEENVERGRFKKVIDSLRETTISQRTPQRVSHRRADKYREREIRHIEIEEMDEDRAELLLECEAGTYVKEFIHGDEGRTDPNLSDELGVMCEIKNLDVIKVHYE